MDDYGEVRFSGVVGQPLRFEVLGYRDLFAPGPVEVLRVAPPWHASYPSTEVITQIPHRSGGALRATDPIATRILMNLYEGFDTHLARSGWYAPNTAVAVEISSVNFRLLYEQFIDCFHGTSASSWADMERTRVTFDTDVSALGHEAEVVLKRVAAYVLADSQVTQIFVDGHTDSSGTQQKNQKLSKRRAESVATFLHSEGIRQELVVVRYHGAILSGGKQYLTQGAFPQPPHHCASCPRLGSRSLTPAMKGRLDQARTVKKCQTLVRLTPPHNARIMNQR